MAKDFQELEKETIRVQQRFERELEVLHSQGVITKPDIQKVMNQAQVSKQALKDAVRRNDLRTDIQEEFFVSLIKDYQLSVQKIIDDAILRLGADVFLRYKFNQVNEKAFTFANEIKFSKSQLVRLESFMAGSLAYALRTLPVRGAWGSPKIDFQKMLNDYAEILQEYAETLRQDNQDNFSIETTRR